MTDTPIHIKFNNRQNPEAEFDAIKLEEVFLRQGMGHTPFQLHLVEFYLIIIIEEGEGLHTIDFTEFTYQPGTIFTIRKDQIHRFHRNPYLKGDLLLFTDDFLVSYLEYLEVLKSLQLLIEILWAPKIQLSEAERADIRHLVYYIKNEYFEVNDEYSQGIIRSELHILLAKLYRIKSHQHTILSPRKYLEEFMLFQRLVEQHHTKHTRVKDYADMMAISTKTLNTVTQSIVHKTAKEFMDEIRTKQIKRLLINTAHSIKEIAYASGFEETTNFYKYFKRQVNITPDQFRLSSRHWAVGQKKSSHWNGIGIKTTNTLSLASLLSLVVHLLWELSHFYSLCAYSYI